MCVCMYVCMYVYSMVVVGGVRFVHEKKEVGKISGWSPFFPIYTFIYKLVKVGRVSRLG